MAYAFSVKNNQVLFSNDVVKDLVLYELEFVTDAPKLCRRLREQAKKTLDHEQLMHRSPREKIRFSFDGLEAPTDFRLRFNHPLYFDHSVEIEVAVKEW